MQNVTILGLTLQDRNLPETIKSASRYLQNRAMSVVAYVDHDVLLQSEHDENVAKLITGAAMTLWADKKILKLVGISSPERYSEVENRSFMRELVKLLVKDNGRIVIAAPNEDAVSNLKKELLDFEPNLNIIHETIIEPISGTIPESEINSINDYSPSVILARGDFALQQKWLHVAGRMINAGIWLAIPEGMRIDCNNSEGMLQRILHKLSFGIFSARAKKVMEGNNDI